jgi:hypothetical protein
MNYIQKAILIAGAAFCFNLTMSAQDITLKNKNITVKEAMEELKKTSGYSFVFSSKDVNTGKEILSWTGDLFKDVISPWAVFAAYLSKITGISAASMMHTFLPLVLLAVMMCIFWLVAGELFDKHIYRALFVILLLVMYMYGYFSIYNAETFTIIRLWQGKATMAAVGIPALLYAFLRLYRLLPDDRRWKEKTVYNAEQKGAICMVWLTVFAVALLTSMSYILSTVMIGCFGFVYGIAKKSLRTAIMVWGTCLVNIAYLGISTLLH